MEMKCLQCGETIPNEDQDYQVIDMEYLRTFDSSKEGSFLCYSCYESLVNYGNTISLYRPDGTKAQFTYDNDILQDLAAATGGDTLAFWDLSETEQSLVESLVTSTFWHSVNAWRGAEITPHETEKWIEVISGWHSSMEETEASRFLNSLQELAETEKFPVALVITRTSNICALGVSVYVPKKNVERFKHLAKDNLQTGLRGDLEFVA